MFLKHHGLGLAFVLVLFLTACGGEKVTPTPIPLPEYLTENTNVITFKSDTIEIAPGNTVEMQTPTPEPMEPVYGSVYLKSIKMSFSEGSYMPEIRIQGQLPTPCHKLLFKVDPINDQRQIIVKLFSTINLKVTCPQTLQPFDQTIRIKDIPSGTYSVWVSGSNLGEFTVP